MRDEFAKETKTFANIEQLNVKCSYNNNILSQTIKQEWNSR